MGSISFSTRNPSLPPGVQQPMEGYITKLSLRSLTGIGIVAVTQLPLYRCRAPDGVVHLRFVSHNRRWRHSAREQEHCPSEFKLSTAITYCGKKVQTATAADRAAHVIITTPAGESFSEPTPTRPTDIVPQLLRKRVRNRAPGRGSEDRPGTPRTGFAPYCQRIQATMMPRQAQRSHCRCGRPGGGRLLVRRNKARDRQGPLKLGVNGPASAPSPDSGRELQRPGGHAEVRTRDDIPRWHGGLMNCVSGRGASATDQQYAEQRRQAAACLLGGI